MTEQPPDDASLADAPRPTPQDTGATPADGDALTPGGYHYTLVDDDTQAAGDRPSSRRPSLRRWLPIAAVAAGAVFVIVGAVWLVSMLFGGGGGDTRVEADVANVIGAFSEGQDGATSTRFEGQVPPGYPEIPTYPDAKVVSSLLQAGDDDATYLVVYDTGDGRRDVADFYTTELDDDPWQLEAGQDGQETSFHQFSKIDDANITGVVLSTESKEDDFTTILVSLRVVSATEGVDPEPFDTGETRSLPAGFPESVPAYPESTAILTAFERQPEGTTFIVSFVTEDDGSDVLNFYRDELAGEEWATADGDPSGSELEGARVLDFQNEEAQISARVTVGTFPQDQDLTQIDVQVVESPVDGG